MYISTEYRRALVWFTSVPEIGKSVAMYTRYISSNKPLSTPILSRNTQYNIVSCLLHNPKAGPEHFNDSEKEHR